MCELEKSLCTTMFEPDFVDMISDLSEVALDEITDDGFVTNIPIIGTIVKLGRFTVSVRDRFLMKSTIAFVKALNNGSISDEELKEHRKKLESNPKRLNEEMERVMILLDRQLEYEKSAYYASLYKMYIKFDEIEWDLFKNLSELLDSLAIKEIQSLCKIRDKKAYHQNDEFDVYSLKRLNALGLVDYYNGMVMYDDSNDSIMAKITSAGIIFCDIVANEKMPELSEK